MQRLQQVLFIPRTGIYLLSRLHDFKVHFKLFRVRFRRKVREIFDLEEKAIVKRSRKLHTGIKEVPPQSVLECKVNSDQVNNNNNNNNNKSEGGLKML